MAASTTSSLATFLHHDIHPQEGHRLLLPFLTTMDRLRLSECSQGLVNYRYNLATVMIVQYPCPTMAKSKGLEQLLLNQQQRGGLEYLRLGHESVLHVLNLASKGCWEKLKTLDLSEVVLYNDHMGEEPGVQELLTDEGVRYLRWALEGGGLKGLEELNLSDCPVGDEGLEMVLDALQNGMCPQLRRLHLHDMLLELLPSLDLPLEQALASGHLRHLEMLDLSSTPSFGEGMARALQGGACPQLASLNLSQSVVSSTGGHALAEALQSGHLRNLQELDLSCNDLGLEGGVAIARALQGGACPQLVKLNLWDCDLSFEDGEALGEAMRSGSCGQLEELHVGGNKDMGDEGFLAVVGAFEAGGCPSLKRLGLHEARLSVQSAIALGQALASDHGHRLQQLDLLAAFEDRDASLAALQAIQQGGAMPNLLRLDVSDTYMDEEHGRILGRAIGGGTLPALEDLWLPSNESMGDEGVVPILVGLWGGGCRQLQALGVGGLGMDRQGAQALTQALASGHLRSLQYLDVNGNGGLGDEGMVEVIKALRACRALRELHVDGTGMGVLAGPALITALQDKAWPALEEVNASRNGELLIDEGLVWALVEVLERRLELCPQLEVANFRETGWDEEGEAGCRLAELLADLEDVEGEEEQAGEEEEEEDEPYGDGPFYGEEEGEFDDNYDTEDEEDPLDD